MDFQGRRTMGVPIGRGANRLKGQEIDPGTILISFGKVLDLWE